MIDTPQTCNPHLDLVGFKFPLPHLARALGGQRNTRIVTIGSSSSTAGEGDVVPFPARLELGLRASYPDRTIDVLNRTSDGLDVADEVDRFQRDIFDLKPAMVIWEVGTEAIFRRDLRDIAFHIDRGLRMLAGREMDAVLMDPPYRAASSYHPDAPDDLKQVVSLIAAETDKARVNLFRRFALMERWVEQDGIGLTALIGGNGRPQQTELAARSVSNAFVLAVRDAALPVVYPESATVEPDRSPPPASQDERRVDLALFKTYPEATGLTESEALSPGAPYVVRVHIGERAAESLVHEPPPPIQSALEPGPEGHMLEVALFGKDFKTHGPTSSRLYLPPQGRSEEVRLGLIAPDRQGPAQFRIAIYHRNHLAQSFLFHGMVANAGEEAADVPRAGFELEYSRTAKFGNLDRLTPRSLSIGVNANGAATHGLFVKSTDEVVEFSLPQKLLDEQTKEFRQLLEDATSTPAGKAKFETYPRAGASTSSEFHRHVAAFARFGQKLHDALYLRRKLRPALRELAQSKGKPIQIIRFDPNFVLPWVAIYDFELPPDVVGAPVPKVCQGTKIVGGKTVPCGHTCDDGVFCINGFWGVRHIVEELIGEGGDDTDAVEKIERVRSEGAIRVAVDMYEKHIEDMHQRLTRELGASYAPVTRRDVLLDLLWNEEERPVLLVVLGHLETKVINGEPYGPRIVLPDGTWLTSSEIMKRVKKREWEQPNTLVLLMGCQTSLVKLGTLTGFNTAFNSAGAAGVAGTEVVAFSGLLTRFAQEITLALWRQNKLGPAIAEFRRDLLVAGNPLAFVFHALGSADIHLKLGK
jgi:hypothetical protein